MNLLWIIAIVAINTPGVAISVTAAPNVPVFVDRDLCYEYIKEKDIKQAACVFIPIGNYPDSENYINLLYNVESPLRDNIDKQGPKTPQ